MGESGYYSIVQYMPVPERMEGVNTGVLLLDKDTGHFNCILTKPIRRIIQVFPGTSHSVIDDAVVSFYNEVSGKQIDDLDTFTEFTLRLRPPLRCTEPVWVNFDGKAFTTVLQDLLSRLVVSHAAT